MLLGKRREIAPEILKRRNQSGNNSQLWMSGGERKAQCYKEQYHIGTWNVRSMNQSKLEVGQQEVARVNIVILGISELRWMGMGEINPDDNNYMYYLGQESLRRNRVALIVNKRV